MPAQSPVRGRMALIAASLAGLLLLFVLGTVFSSGPVIEAGGTVPAARVEISEYMTSNGSAYPDGNGLFSDWVELHNAHIPRRLGAVRRQYDLAAARPYPGSG